MKTRDELIQMRRELGLTQAQLARMAEIGRLTVIKWEAGGTVRPCTENAIRTAIGRRMRELDGVTL